ncbi:CapA family protein [Micromonospora narathiwatensis]|uniref:Poly-gamma-glutamate synthesis protein (Capsule biosynthesis protein) n=1 Tax=Micromonospora narathiwatensis TaxID=299146 RepID=A0A1A8ZUT1_9ACTN|nr:CapA family protein [Micromonospora narathiwatensis]SBT47652.1 poly-gamma-glutamate synthesis protein (capsule biosynthesis protein) [Micromonospora narathiwatensis]
MREGSGRGKVITVGLLVLVLLAGGVFWVLRNRDESRTPAGPSQAGQPVAAGSVPTPPDPKPRRDSSGRRIFTVLGAGDILIHPELTSQARRDAERGGNPGGLDFNPLLQQVRPAVSGADLAICHLETPLAPPNGPFIGFPKFNVPPQIVDAIRGTGFDACSTSSNHTIDQGEQGVKRTLDALDAAKIRHTGSARTKQEALTPAIYVKNGVKVGHLAYALHFNGLKRPAGKEWMANLIEPAEILAAAKRLRAAGAEIVVLSMHWGTEYLHQPDADQEKWVRPLIASPDIDLILGHHAHVVQPIEKIGADWVVYGMGNQVARHLEPIFDNREGVMARFTFTEVASKKWRVTLAEAIPVWVDLNPDVRLIDLPAALADETTSPARRVSYQAALDRIRGHLLAKGGADAGLKVLGPPPAQTGTAGPSEPEGARPALDG